MLTVMRDNVNEVLQWHQAMLVKVEPLVPRDGEDRATEMRSEDLVQVDRETFRRYIEASVTKLSAITQ